MRIIAGNFKGKKIFLPKDNNTRPLRDYVKESIFNIIEHSKHINFRLENSKVLDLFSGVGSFGLECISRGAAKVTFFEKYSKALMILKKNINFLKCSNKVQIVENDIFKFVKIHNLNNQKYDLIFLDPPFNETNVEKLLNVIFQNKILRRESVIILHRNKKTVDKLPCEFKIFIQKNYGISKIIFGRFI
tara:strand:- start:6500 stop:7066 length:567 start_codon:yes stop_codon:yes gene_type:complete